MEFYAPEMHTGTNNNKAVVLTVPVRVAILDDHQSIVDGYLFRLGSAEDLTVVGAVNYGEQLEALLDDSRVDVLLMDVIVPVSAENPNSYPILHTIPDLLERHPGLSILVISVLNQTALVEALVEAGISGYILKDDHESIRELAKIVAAVAHGGIYFSQAVYRPLMRARESHGSLPLTERQLEALSLCTAYPNHSTAELADRLGVAHSTLRNLLSGAYLRLGVRTRAAAIAELQRSGVLPPTGPEPAEDNAG